MKPGSLQNCNRRNSLRLSPEHSVESVFKSPAAFFWLVLHGLCCIVSLVLGFRFSRLIFLLIFASSSNSPETPYHRPGSKLAGLQNIHGGATEVEINYPYNNNGRPNGDSNSNPNPNPNLVSQGKSSRVHVGRHGILIRPWPHPDPGEVMKAHQLLERVQQEQRLIYGVKERRTVIVITPTYVRTFQSVHLTGLMHTLMLVPGRDMKIPSPEVRQGSSEVGIEDSLVDLKDDDSLTKLTVAELRAMMRRNGIQPTGRKRDLILALKKISRKESAVQNSGNGLPKVVQDCLPETIPDQVISQGRKNRRKSSIIVSVKDSQSLVQCVADNADKLQVTGKNSTSFKKRYNKSKGIVDVIAQSSNCKKETQNTNEPFTKNENKDCEESMIEANASDKVLARKKRKTLKVIEKSKIIETGAVGENELVSNFEQPWTMLVHKKVQPGWVAYNPAIMRPSSPLDTANIIKMISWNVNGLRALLKRKDDNSFVQLTQRENFDVLCLQETKLQEKDVEQIKQCLLDGYDNSFWTCSVSKLGYAGTAVISRIKPVSVKFGLGIPDHDGEGRLITIEFDTVYLVAGYVPNSGQKLERLSYRVQQWDPSLSSYLKDLEKKKPVVLTGDLNCAHKEIDIYNPDGNRRSAGFTDEERTSFEENFLNRGFVDSFRQQHPEAVGYTYWGYRQGARPGNKGWRLDYFLVSDSIADKVYDSYIIPDVNGSDHCPIGLILKC